MMCTHVTEELLICCRPAKDFNLDLQLSQGHEARESACILARRRRIPLGVI